jgi:hypothetical protein
MAMLNTSKLQGKPQGVWTRGVPTKRGRKGDEYQCPVCAEAGMDSKGVHLLIYSGRQTTLALPTHAIAVIGNLYLIGLAYDLMADLTQLYPEK